MVPRAFWFLSIFGGLFLLIYAAYRHDPVFVMGQVTGLLIYVRNLWLLYRPKRIVDAPSTS